MAFVQATGLPAQGASQASHEMTTFRFMIQRAMSIDVDSAVPLLQQNAALAATLVRDGFFDQILLPLLSDELANYTQANQVCCMLDKAKIDTPFTRAAWALCAFKKRGECGYLNFYMTVLTWRNITLLDDVNLQLTNFTSERFPHLNRRFTELAAEIRRLAEERST